MCLIVIGLFAVNDSGNRRRAAADGQPRPDLGRAVPARGRRRAAHRDGPAWRSSAAWRADGPMLATVLITTGVIALAVPGSTRVRGRVPDPERHLRPGLGLGGRRSRRDRPRRHVHAAPDLGGAARGRGQRRARSRPRPPPGRDRGDRPARRRPALPLLLAGRPSPTTLRWQRRSAGSRDDPDSSSPTIDWAALSPDLALLGGASRLPRRRPLFLPWSWRRPFGAAVAALCLRRRRHRGRNRLFAVDDSGQERRRRRDPARSPGRARADPRSRVGPAGGRGRPRLGAPGAQPRGRVLRAPPLRRRGNGVLRRRLEPDDAVPRARVVLDLALRPLRDRRRIARPRSRPASST